MTLLRRIGIMAAILLAMLGLNAQGAAASPASQRIIAVGDLHGDYSAWLDIARAAGLIDARNHWTAGRTILVQLGDIVDRAPDSLRIIRSLQQLQKEAPRAGGKVVVVLGNHEAMNLLGDYRYTTPGEFAAFADSHSAGRRDRVYELNRSQLEAFYRLQDSKITPEQVRAKWMADHPLGWVEHKLAWSPSGDLGKWAARNPAIVKIDGTLFVHGGISAEYARIPLDEVNRRVAVAMASAQDTPTSPLNDPLGPLWYRGLVMRDTDAEAVRAQHPAPALTADQEITAALTAYGAQRMVIGHTPDRNGIEIVDGGRLARIDTGISRAYGGPLTWLEIVGGKMIPRSVGRTSP